ncbi:serine hydrolase domain-containing protein [Sabulibacter ruber]|uniref:serine hydrolase domain-containing protein n=1 Tax=Sabulibacter ruber TaxID=2811901 RepID=UPI001A96DF17|nr:serine hydrolase domain-containing protein [Sabulibacter ruber]
MKKNILWVLFLLLAVNPLAAQPQLNAQRLDSVVQAYKALGYAGNVLIAHKNKVVYQRSYGLANIETKAPVNTATLFKIESLGKMFTAVLVLQLVEKGKLRLDVPINQYLSREEYALPLMDKVTVHHLLTHTSGYAATAPNPASKRKMNHVKLAFQEPGSQALYSNVGYEVLGEVVARVTGKTFEEALRARILQPAGIKNFYHNDRNGKLTNVALPYKFLSETKYRLVEENRAVQAGPDGGWLTSIEDLFRFYKAYRNHKYFSANTWEMIRTANQTVTPQPLKTEVFTYGLNWLPSGSVGEHLIYGHSGGGMAYSSALYFDPETGYAVITLSNTAQKSRGPVANFFNVLNNRPLLPIEPTTEYQLMTLIDLNGMDHFRKNHPEYVSQLLGNQQPSSFFFTRLIDNYQEVKEYQMVFPVVEVAEQYLPGLSIWHYMKADAHFNLKNFAEAEKENRLAKEKAEKEGSPHVKWYIDELALKLQNQKAQTAQNVAEQ